jgi:signal peptidase II
MGMPAQAKPGWLWGPWSGLGLSIAAATLAIDQAHKWWMMIVYRIQDKGRVTVTPFLDLVFVKNLGISYGIGAGSIGQATLAVFALLAALALAVWLARGAHNRLMAGSLGMIIGGAVGNAIDRLHLGGVADFFLLHARGYSWYVFNIADVAIVAGVLGLLYDSFRSSRDGAAKRP